MRTSSSWVAAWMRADSSAMRSPSRASCAPRSPVAVAGPRTGDSSGGPAGGGRCVEDVDGAEPLSAHMNHCNPPSLKGLLRPPAPIRSRIEVCRVSVRERAACGRRDGQKKRFWRHARLAPQRPEEAVKYKMQEKCTRCGRRNGRGARRVNVGRPFPSGRCLTYSEARISFGSLTLISAWSGRRSCDGFAHGGREGGPWLTRHRERKRSVRATGIQRYCRSPRMWLRPARWSSHP